MTFLFSFITSGLVIFIQCQREVFFGSMQLCGNLPNSSYLTPLSWSSAQRVYLFNFKSRNPQNLGGSQRLSSSSMVL